MNGRHLLQNNPPPQRVAWIPPSPLPLPEKIMRGVESAVSRERHEESVPDLWHRCCEAGRLQKNMERKEQRCKKLSISNTGRT
mmetsp:Transcript_117204/g.239791  ORF Transcript_117204/g.239791 Transcript_117204/m.239791 type:complete len:83 (-) Transcript_117204:3619-3867(-)